ncbi:MAG TPA: hypothetical protein VNZ86_14180, partial [Bacteroidia bacterium]|nr:hypothetical protein [Bacteroidia bacterium]
MSLHRSNFQILLLLLVLTVQSASAASYYSKATGGNWNATSTWVTACGGTSSPGTLPGSTDDVTICSGTVYMNATCSCKSITVNNGGILTFNTASVTMTIAGGITVGTGGTINYTSNSTSVTINLGGNLSCISGGSFSLVKNGVQYGSLVFNGSTNTSISGTGNMAVNSMTLNTGSAATSVSVLTNSFTFGGPTYFKLTRGTFKWNNSGTFTDCYNSGSSTKLTIPYGVVLEADAGIMNLCQNGQPVLSGGLVLNGGTVNMASGTGGQTDLQYVDNGGAPQLYVNIGTLNVYGGINDNGAYSNYLDFEMTGGTINLSLGGQSPNYENLLLNNLTGGKTIMSAGLITLEEAANNNSTLDLDFGGPSIGAMGSGTFNVTGGTIQFGTAASSSGSNQYWFEAHASNNYPNFLLHGTSTSSVLVKANNTSNFLIQSLNISNTYCSYDMRDATGGFSNQMTIYGTNGTGAFLNYGSFIQRTSTVLFTGTVQQGLGSAGGSITTFHNVVINNTSGTTSSTGVIQQAATNLDATGVMTFTNGSYSLNGFTLTIQNGAAGAMTGASSSSYLISEDQSSGNMSSALQWNIGNATSGTNFIIPFGYNGSYIPFTFAVTTASGNTGTTLTLATYESAYGTTLPFPSMTGQVVTSTNGALSNAAGCHPNTANNSDLIVNRYWEITVGTQASLVAGLTFSYPGSENQTIPLCGGGSGGNL